MRLFDHAHYSNAASFSKLKMCAMLKRLRRRRSPHWGHAIVRRLDLRNQANVPSFATGYRVISAAPHHLVPMHTGTTPLIFLNDD